MKIIRAASIFFAAALVAASLASPVAAGFAQQKTWAGNATSSSGSTEAVTLQNFANYNDVLGVTVSFVAGATNTGATTFSINGGTPTAIEKLSPSGLVALSGGEIVAGATSQVIYDGTEFILLTNYSTLPSLWGGNGGGSASAQTATISGISSLINLLGAEIVYIAPGTNTGAVTLAVSGLTAKSVLKPSPSGLVALTGGEIQSGKLTAMIWDGTEYVLQINYNPQSAGTGPKGAFSGLTINNDGGSPNTIIDVAATQIVLQDSSVDRINVASLSVTINSALSGAGGLDTGSLANSTWYALWVIYNPTTQTASGLMSLSATAPTLPSGYTYAARVGWQRTDSSGNFYRIKQIGRRAQYVVTPTTNTAVLPVMTNAASPSGWLAISVSNFVPPTAATIIGVAATGNSAVSVAPNGNYSNSLGSLSNTPPVTVEPPNFNAAAQEFEFILESTNIYWATQTSSSGVTQLMTMGWTDNL